MGKLFIFLRRIFRSQLRASIVLSVDWNEAIQMLWGATVDDGWAVNDREGPLQSRVEDSYC